MDKIKALIEAVRGRMAMGPEEKPRAVNWKRGGLMRAPFSVSCSNAPVPLLRSHLLTGWHNSLLTRRPRCLLLLFSHLLCTVSSPQAGPSFLYTYLLLRRSMPGLPQSKGSPELNAVRVSKTPECSFDCHLDISVWNSTVWRIILL